MAHLLLKHLGAEVTHTTSAHIPLVRASCAAHLDTRRPAKRGSGRGASYVLRRGRMNLVMSCLPCQRYSVENTGYRTPRSEGGAGETAEVAQEME